MGHVQPGQRTHRPPRLRDAVPPRGPRPPRPTPARQGRRRLHVRIALADPESRYVAERDAEEGLNGTFRDRIRSTLDHFRPLFGVEGIELRFHRTPMYNSVFRGDDEMFVTPHLFALKGYRAPIFFLRRAFDDGIFDGFVAHLDRLWAKTEPISRP